MQHRESLPGVFQLPDGVRAVRGDKNLHHPGVVASRQRLDDLAEEAQHHARGHVDRGDDLRGLDDSRGGEVVFQQRQIHAVHRAGPLATRSPWRASTTAIMWPRA
jgi:hypothetical protein